MKKQRSDISHDEMCLISSFHILIVGKQSRKKFIITPIIIFCASTVGLSVQNDSRFKFMVEIRYQKKATTDKWWKLHQKKLNFPSHNFFYIFTGSRKKNK